MLALLLYAAFVACSCPSAPPPAADPPAAPAESEQAPRKAASEGKSSVRLKLPATVSSVTAAPGSGPATVSAKATARDIEVTAENAPICGADQLEVEARRAGDRISLWVTGGTVCPGGQVGRVVVQVTDRAEVTGADQVAFTVGSEGHANMLGIAPIRR